LRHDPAIGKQSEMSSFHIADIENRLNNSDWIITRAAGNDLDISETWVIGKYHKTVTLVFTGMGDLDVLPIEKSYGCHLQNDPSVSLYFSKNNRKEWEKNLLDFMKKLEEIIRYSAQTE
jgi:hypothetical protein